MRTYTILTTRDPAALAQFVQTVQTIGATAVTVFTRPEFVTPDRPPGVASEADFTRQAEEAGARKDWKEAARLTEEAQKVRTQLMAAAKTGAQWVIDILEPVKEMSQIIVLGNLHWPAAEPFTAAGFMAKLEAISTTLLSVGIGGIKQLTPLSERTYIPLAGGGHAAPGDPERGSVVPPYETTPAQPKHVRHASIPAALSEKQARFAELRLGLDRGGQRRSRQEAGNLLGYSAGVGAKMENSIAAAWSTYLSTVNENSST